MSLSMPSPSRTARAGIRLFTQSGMSRTDACRAVVACCDAAKRRISTISPQDVTWLNQVRAAAISGIGKRAMRGTPTEGKAHDRA